MLHYQIECKYKNYLERQRKEIEEFKNADALEIPQNVDFMSLSQLSKVEAERLQDAKPRTLHAASRLPGIRPSTLMILHKLAKRQQLHEHEADPS